ncbi:MAG: imidazolonepropionase [Clostridia bacterium]|nr:imidazolonepropionase [Clostridia bacterium]
MTKRNYTHVKELLPAILKMVEQGKTQREIAEHYGLKDKMVVKRLLERERRKERNQRKSRGRKPAKTLQEYKYENKRLKMEVELLRDYLSRTEGM